MGEVYKARDTRLERAVAVKILTAKLAADPQFRERFDREARAISQLTHPHICTLYDVGEHDGTAFLVMELLDGETLAERLQKGALPLAEALTIAIQIADALGAAHRRGILHRDLKPSNVMLTRAAPSCSTSGWQSERVRLSRAPSLPCCRPRHRTLTAQGTILGTLQYMAPEQVEGKDADLRTDVFAFGALLYEVLTGRKAFEGDSAGRPDRHDSRRDPQAVTVLRPTTPPALERVVRRCLSQES